jgi:hypothetical protein
MGIQVQCPKCREEFDHAMDGNPESPYWRCGSFASSASGFRQSEKCRITQLENACFAAAAMLGAKRDALGTPEDARKLLNLALANQQENDRGKGAKEAAWMGQIRRSGAQAGAGSQVRSRRTEET